MRTLITLAMISLTGSHLDRHLIGMNLESDLFPGNLTKSIIGDDRPRSGVVHLGGSDPQRSVNQLGDPIRIFNFHILELPPEIE